MSEITTEKGRFLPKNVKPLRYVISIEPNLTSFAYKGTVATELEILVDSNSITSNAHDEIAFKSTTLLSEGSQALDVDLTRDHAAEQYTITFSSTLKAGAKVVLKHTFEGLHNEGMSGFYRTIYHDEDGNRRVLVSTQGQATGARRIFPCFDEPHLKAKFDMTLIIEKQQLCLMNMPVKTKKELDGKVHHTFATTPLMSPYLVCLIVGENFHSIKTDDFSVPLEIYTEGPKAAKRAQYSMALAVRTLKFFEKAFKHTFPLPKMDFASFPHFFSGAMENWGLITFGPQWLLYDEKTDGFEQKRAVSNTVVHELSHQWFGDLVTTKTWDSTWLNEGFATWAELYANNTFYPEWHLWDNFVATEMEEAFQLDSLRDSHSIELKAEPGKEEEVLDAISYQKGSVVLHMITEILGTDVFVEGVAKYVNKFAYDSTLTTDLWASLSSHSGVNVGEIMTPWVWQTGHPVLLVEEDESNGVIKVKQHRYLVTNDVKPEEDALWPIALNIRTKDGVHRGEMLHDRVGEYKTDLSFYKINANHSSFYRTCYTATRFEKLLQSCLNSDFNVQDRAGLLSDVSALAQAGYLPTSMLLTWIDSLKHEKNVVVWSVMLDRLDNLKKNWVNEDDKVKNALNKFQLHLLDDRLQQVGWNFHKDDEPSFQKLKTSWFNGAVEAKSPDVVKAAREMYSAYMTGDEDAIDPNIRIAVFKTALQNGGSEEFDFLLKSFLDTNKTVIHIDCAKALGYTSAPENLRTLCALFLESEKISVADVFYICCSFQHSPANARILLDFVDEHWDQFIGRFNGIIFLRQMLSRQLTYTLISQDGLTEAKALLARKEIADLAMSNNQSLDILRAGIQWTDRSRDEVSTWLVEHGYLS